MYIDLLGEPFAFKNTKLSMDRKVAKHLLAEAHEALPYEYSALLCGRADTITRHIAMPTSTVDQHTFNWDGPSFLRALQTIRQSNLQWLGVLHTHPHSPPLPSRHDAAGWHYPALSYWILGMETPATPEWRVYQWLEGMFVERAYRVIDDI
jgi:[CysO sulfur-carrier protein]-S-L-cysteine hydrolase